MKKIYLALFLLISLSRSFGQTSSRKQTLSHLTKLDWRLGIGLGLTVEPRISNAITIDLTAGFGGGYYIDRSTFEYYILKFAWYFSATPKYFYNIKKRINQGKAVQNNSGNYIGLRVKYSEPIIHLADVSNAIRNSILTNIHWGLQRSLGVKSMFSSQIGGGYAMDAGDGSGTFYPSFDFKISFILSKRKKQE